jgi:hypothetical protein
MPSRRTSYQPSAIEGSCPGDEFAALHTHYWTTERIAQAAAVVAGALSRGRPRRFDQADPRDCRRWAGTTRSGKSAAWRRPAARRQKNLSVATVSMATGPCRLRAGMHVARPGREVTDVKAGRRAHGPLSLPGHQNPGPQRGPAALVKDHGLGSAVAGAKDGPVAGNRTR